MSPGSPLARLLEDDRVPKYAHNAKYDLTVLAEHGIAVANLCFDTMIAAYLLNEKGLGLKDLAFTRLNVEMTPITDLIGKNGKGQLTMAQVAPEQVAAYAGADAAVTWRLAGLFRPEMEAQGLWKLFDEVEMPLVPVLAQMERDGVALDVAGPAGACPATSSSASATWRGRSTRPWATASTSTPRSSSPRCSSRSSSSTRSSAPRPATPPIPASWRSCAASTR